MAKLRGYEIDMIIIDDPALDFHCDKCGKNKSSVWAYMPGKQKYCDECVPRGCSCNENEDGTQDLDLLGRPMPCCEYWYIEKDKE